LEQPSRREGYHSAFDADDNALFMAAAAAEAAAASSYMRKDI